MNGRRIAAAAILSFATYCRPFNIDIRPSPTNRLVRGRTHLFGPDAQNQQQHDDKRNDRQRRPSTSTTSGSLSPHRVPEAELDFIGGGFGLLGHSSPPFPYAIEMMPLQTANDGGGGDGRRPDGLIIRHLEDEDITSILPEIVREFGSLIAPPPSTTTKPTEPGDELSSKVENFLFSLTVLIGLTQRVKRRKEGYSGSGPPRRPDHNVVCLVERIPRGADDDGDGDDRDGRGRMSHAGQIVGIAELSWQPPDPNSNAPPFVLPYFAKALISRFLVRGNGGGGDKVGGGDYAVPGGYVSNVLVWKARRGRGYGRVLMAACEGIANMWGCPDVSLHVDANEYSGGVARDLYRSLGYEGVPDGGGGGASSGGNGRAAGGYGWMGPHLANQGLYLVDGVPLLYLRKRLKVEG